MMKRLLICAVVTLASSACHSPVVPTPPAPVPPVIDVVTPQPPPSPEPAVPVPPTPLPPPTPTPPTPKERYALVIVAKEPRFPFEGVPQLVIQGDRATLGGWSDGQVFRQTPRTFIVRFGDYATLAVFDAGASGGWQFSINSLYGSAFGTVEED